MTRSQREARQPTNAPEAFGALKGRGWGVLVRDVCRPSMADLWLRPPEELLEFLNKWSLICRKTGMTLS